MTFGRSKQATVRFEEKGVWDDHGSLELGDDGFFYLKSNPNSLTLVDGGKVDVTRYKPGSIIQMGEARFRLVYSPVRQTTVNRSEILVVVFAVAAVISQFFLMYYLST